eukprot:TRINITY_DN416_c0_g1::TRINITY_DN416_c0_g1_i2::g.2606::m.2606 TRINITY_DN416_c0_g1::TRINITY_DN416_c0_g1_i2::g.2606  ORF type:complete len:154 (-),score=-18.51,DUF1732/PF08340.6/71,DUF1732/PF08340.6/0.22,TEX12/PF15219.1/0.17 TRINITY_DN416_c0_g1_i2:56-517(-)
MPTKQKMNQKIVYELDVIDTAQVPTAVPYALFNEFCTYIKQRQLLKPEEKDGLQPPQEQSLKNIDSTKLVRKHSNDTFLVDDSEPSRKRSRINHASEFDRVLREKEAAYTNELDTVLREKEAIKEELARMKNDLANARRVLGSISEDCIESIK